MQVKEKSLKDALNATRLLELPKQYRGENELFWLKAIALVKKRDATQSYCLTEHKADGRILYKKDFGTMSPITGLISIHPYLYLDTQQFCPYDTISQKRVALAKYIGGDEEAESAVQDMPDEDVELAIREIAIAMQYDAETLDKSNKMVSELVHNQEQVHPDDDMKQTECHKDNSNMGDENDTHVDVGNDAVMENTEKVKRKRGRKPSASKTDKK